MQSSAGLRSSGLRSANSPQRMNASVVTAEPTGLQVSILPEQEMTLMLKMQ